MPNRILMVACVAALWGGCFYASLSISKLDLGYWGALCGSWGCLPETGPLVSVHAMWLTTIGGVSWLARLAIPSLHSWQPWAGFTLALSVFTISLLGIECRNHILLGGHWNELMKFSLYKILVWTDWPLVQAMACCGLNFVVARAMSNSTAPVLVAQAD